MKSFFKKLKKSIVSYCMINKLFISYVILALIGTIVARFFSFGHTFYLKAHVTDLAMILLIGLFGYLFKPKNRYKYFLVWLIIFAAIETINVIYYTFFTSFASFGELATLGQTETVAGSIFEKLHIINFVYVLSPVIFYITHLKISKTSYYTFIEKINRTKKSMLGILAAAFICLAISFGTATKTDYSRIAKQWNRVYIANYSDLMGLKSEKIWWEGNAGKSDFKLIDDVIAWMPLPESYRGDNVPFHRARADERR